MKKWIWEISIGAVILLVAAFFIGRSTMPNPNAVSLPKPELAEGQRGELGIDKNVNESTIDRYLGRTDSVYRDLRMLEDPGNYEAIGGNSKLTGYVNGFEVVPFPYITNVEGLPDEVGGTYSGETLYTKNGDEYVANAIDSRIRIGSKVKIAENDDSNSFAIFVEDSSIEISKDLANNIFIKTF